MRERWSRRVQLALAVVGAAMIAGAAVVAIGSAADGGGGGAGAPPVEGARSVDAMLSGIPQHGLTLGNPAARVQVFEYCDLESTICKQDAEAVLPQVIAAKVATGEAKLTFRNFVIISPQSHAASAAAIAAGAQGRGWNFIDDFYRNQGTPNTGFATGEFLESIAAVAGIGDMSRWNSERRGGQAKARAVATTKEAKGLGLIGTPTFAIAGPRTHGLEVLEDLDQLRSSSKVAAALERAIGAAG
jgi:protein-disulfide isomerase